MIVYLGKSSYAMYILHVPVLWWCLRRSMEFPPVLYIAIVIAVSALVEAASLDPSVVSCGGGVVLEPANRVSLRATGEVVFLSVPLEVLAERVRPGAERPLIRTEGDLERLFRDREPLYREFAAHVVDASGPAEDVAAAIEKELLRWSA